MKPIVYPLKWDGGGFCGCGCSFLANTIERFQGASIETIKVWVREKYYRNLIRKHFPEYQELADKIELLS